MQKNSLVDLYRIAFNQCPDGIAFYSDPPNFEHQLTWSQVWHHSQQLAQQLRTAGLQSGQRVGIIANSSWRWEVAQLATLMCQAVVVGIDPLESETNLSTIASKAKIEYIFFEQRHWLEKWQRATGRSSLPLDLAMIARLTNSREALALPGPPPSLDHEAIIIFTSGTTAEPKGISYSHRQVLFAVESLLGLYPEVADKPNTICWLPLANLFQRMINFGAVACKGTIYFIENPVEVIANLQVVKPDIFISVPRFYEKIYEGIQAKISKAPIVLRQFLQFGIWLASVRWRLSQKLKWVPSHGILLAPWDFLFLRKLRMVFGGKVKVLISGSAPLRKEIAIFFHSIGLPILEAYGASENTVPIAANTLKHFRLGSVGRPVIDGSVKISQEGEVLVKNAGLFSGYLGSSHRDCFIEGYYKTGDLGSFDEDGFLYLMGRQNSMFKTTTGKKVSVAEIESQFKTIPYIDQVVVVGEGRKLPMVLLSLDLSGLAAFQNISVASLWDQNLGELPTAHQILVENMVRANWQAMDLAVKPGGAIIIPRRFSMERQEVTPNLKLRTKTIERQFQDQLDELYHLADEDQRFPVLFSSGENKPNRPSEAVSAGARWKTIAQIAVQAFQIEWMHIIGRQSDKQTARRLGQIFRKGLGTLKGPLQKVGQMISHLGDELPDEFREEISQLFREGSPVSSQIIRSMVEEELKRPIPALFSEWRDAPISTASIGQVHWARLTTGEEVAVKVLVPGVEKMLRADLQILRWSLPILRRLLRFDSIVPHFQELKELLLSECDFTMEAQNLEVFAKIFSGDSQLIIPKVYRKLSTQKVLVMEYIHGQSFEEFCSSASKEEKQQAAEIIWTISSRSINLYGIFNADPHPGNFIFSHGKVGIIDFGFCKHWKSDFIKLWKRQVLAGQNNNLAEFEQASRALGLVHSRDKNYYRNLLQIYQRIIFLPWLHDQPFHFTHQFVKEYLQTLMQFQISVAGLHLPHEFLSLSRLYWGNFVLMADLDATANFHQLTIPYVKAEMRELKG